MSNTIDQVALSYLHKTEIPNNMGFTDKEFQKKMSDVGWHPSYSWCALFAELCAKEGAPEFYSKYEKQFSPSAIVTFRNFKALLLISQVPKVGYLACWQHGSTAEGHMGVVVGVKGENIFQTSEGNSNENGSREGYEVAYKPDRKIDYTKGEHKLNLLGFIQTY